jgi:S1-C subfamily serine protease
MPKRPVSRQIPPLPKSTAAPRSARVPDPGDKSLYYLTGITVVVIILIFLVFAVVSAPQRRLASLPNNQGQLAEAFQVSNTFQGVGESDETLSIGDLISRYEGAVVTVHTDTGLGSGFFIKGRNLVATNFHVVRGAKDIWVETADHQQVKSSGAAVFAPERDLALLHCNVTDSNFGLKLAAALPKRGDDVIAWGSSAGLQGTVSEGIVSAIRRVDELGEDPTFDPATNVIQTTAPISHGNSGGPLMNLHGDVVGVNSFFHAGGQNLNFAVSAEHVKELLTRAVD